MEKTVAKFRDFSEAEKSDHEFYRKLTGEERLDILLQLSKQEPERPLERVFELLNSHGVEYVTKCRGGESKLWLFRMT